MKKSILLFIFPIFYTLTFSQNAILKGNVYSENKEALFAVNVVVDASKGIATQTNLKGQYSLDLPEGNYFILFSFIGKENLIKEVYLKSGVETIIDVTLIEKLNEIAIVTVSGGKYEKKFGEEIVSMEVIPPSIIQNNVAQAQEALNKVPGYQNIGKSPSIRGGSSFASGASSRTLFLIDGVPQLSPENGAIYFETLPLENLQQVEVIKGASSSIYGSSALNGIINFRTAWPKKGVPFIRTTTAIGSYQKFTGNLIKSKNDKETRMQNPNNWWKEENHLPVFLNQTLEYREAFKKIDLVVGAYYRHDQNFKKDAEYDRFRINGKIRHISQKIDGLTIGTAWNFAYEEGGQFFMWSGVDGNALLPSDPKSAFNKDVRTDFIQRRMSISPFISYFDNKQNRHSINIKYYNNQSTNFSLESNTTNHIYGEYIFDKTAKAKGINFLTGITGHHTKNTGLNVGNKKYTASNFGAFIQTEKKFFNKLNISGGIRVEYNKVDSIIPQNKLTILSLFKKNGDFTSSVKPLIRFGLNYEVTKGTYLRASWGQGFRVPTINEYFVDLKRTIQVTSNPELLPENGWTAEIGVKQGVKVGSWQGYFDVAGFVTKYIDLIDFNLQSNFTIKAENLDNARISGIELSALGQGELFGYPLTFLTGYTFMQPILLNPSESRKLTYPETYKYINYRNKHNFKIDIESTIKKFSFGFSTVYTSFMINMPITTSSVPGVIEYREKNPNGEWVLDTRIRYNFSEKSTLSFLVKNLLNNEYTTRPGILEAPRNYTIQFQHQF